MTQAAPIKVGLIGCGGNGRGHLKRMSEIKGVELVGLADPSTNARALAHEAVQQPDLPGFRNHRKLLADTEPDAVVISTPHTLHHQQIIDSLEAGCHVLCEKPLICSTQEARDVIAARDATGLILGIAYQRHIMPPYMYCRQAIASGAIGEVTSVSCWQAQAWWHLTRGTWRVKPELSGGGQLNDSASHLLDAVLWMTQLQPKVVSAFVDKLDTEVDIVSAVTTQCVGGALCNFSVIGNAPPGFGVWEDIVMWGTTGALIIRNMQDVYYLTPGNPEQKVPRREMPKGSDPDTNFIAAIRGTKEIAAPAECGMSVIQLTEAIWCAADIGKAVKVEY